MGALSQKRIAHRDVKPGNVLLMADGRVALADLGLAARWPLEEREKGKDGGGGEKEVEDGRGEPTPSSSSCPLSHRPLPPAGTRWYRPPEALYGGAADSGPGADLWGAGCVLAEALGLSAPLAAGETDLDQVARVSELMGGPPDPKDWPGVAELPDFAALASVAAGSWSQGAGEEGEEGGTAAVGSSSRTLPEKENENGYKFAAHLPDAPDSALSLLSMLLSYDPSKRGTAEEALAHRYFHEHPLPATRRGVAAAVAAVVGAVERERARAAQQRRRRQQ